MAGPENTFIGAVHRHLPPVTELYRMKNHNQYNGGIPDVWYSGELDLWIEYKFIKVPARPDTLISMVKDKDPELSALQQAWLKGRHAEGRNVGVIVGSKDGGVWFPGTSWDTPITAEEFRTRLQTRSLLGALIVSLTSR